MEICLLSFSSVWHMWFCDFRTGSGFFHACLNKTHRSSSHFCCVCVFCCPTPPVTTNVLTWVDLTSVLAPAFSLRRSHILDECSAATSLHGILDSSPGETATRQFWKWHEGIVAQPAPSWQGLRSPPVESIIRTVSEQEVTASRSNYKKRHFEKNVPEVTQHSSQQLGCGWQFHCFSQMPFQMPIQRLVECPHPPPTFLIKWKFLDQFNIFALVYPTICISPILCLSFQAISKLACSIHHSRRHNLLFSFWMFLADNVVQQEAGGGTAPWEIFPLNTVYCICMTALTELIIVRKQTSRMLWGVIKWAFSWHLS